MQKLTGKRVLITGAASGIGYATALLFAQEGASVAIVDIDEVRGCVVVDEIRTQGGQAIFVQCDVSQARDCQRAVEETVKAFGGLDILFNNAGIVIRANVLETTEEEWDRAMAINVKSIFLMSKYAIPYLANPDRDSVIVNTGSALSLAGARNVISYAASKAAVYNMTKAMALDHCLQRIRVVCVCPGDTDTPMLHEEAKQLGIPEQELINSSIARRPLRRIGSPEDIAKAVLYLASDDGRYITGTALVVDGGGLAAYGTGM